MLSLFLYVINNKNKFELYSDVYNVSTRQKYNFHQPSSCLSLYKKGVYSTGMKVFNSLSQSIKIFSDNSNQFICSLLLPCR